MPEIKIKTEEGKTLTVIAKDGKDGEKGEKGDIFADGVVTIRGKDGKDGAKGEKGDTPSDEEIISLIQPIIKDLPIAKDGHTPTEEELKNIIIPLIPEPLNGINGKDGLNGKDGSPDTPEQIKEKLEGLENGLNYESLSNLPDIAKIARLSVKTSSKTVGITELDGTRIINPTNNQVLKYNSTTGLWENGTGGGGGSGTPGGSDLDVQFNNAGSFGGDGIFQYDYNTYRLQIPNIKAYDTNGITFSNFDVSSDVAVFGGTDTDSSGQYQDALFYKLLLPNEARDEVLVTDTNRYVRTSGVSTTALGYISTLTSNAQTQINAKLGTTLANTNIIVGNASNVATAVSVSGDATMANTGALTIADSAVTYAKIQNVATDRLLGRDTAGSGVVEEIAVGGGIEFTGSTSIQTSAFTGDVTKSAGGTALTIASDAVTYAKMQDVSATARVLGRVTAGSGDVEEIVIDTDLSSVSASDDTVASAKAIKTYVDSRPITIFSANYGADIAAAGASRFLALTSAGLPDSGTENQRDFPLPVAGTAKNFYFTTTTAQSGTGSLVLTIRKNGADTSIVITIAAGSAAGQFSDTTNTESFAVGDTLSVKVTNNASVNSAAYNGASLAFY